MSRKGQTILPTSRLAVCDGKDGMTPARAKNVAKSMRSRGARAQAYRCAFCRQWHVGTTPKLRRK